MKYLVVKLCASILIGLIVLISVQWGMANASYFSVLNQLGLLQQQGTNQRTFDADYRLNKEMQRMLSLHTDHPHYLMTAGSVYEWQASQSTNLERKREFFNNALNSYESSLKLRNNWVIAWTRIVEINAYLGNFGPEFANAVEMSDKFGPHNIETGQVLAFVLLNHWRNLTPQEIDIAINHLNQLMSNGQFKKIYQYAMSIGQEKFFCGLISINNNSSNKC